MNNEEKFLTAKTEDLFRLCEKYCEPQFSFFLNEAEQALIKREIGDRYGFNCRYFGGYDGALRSVLGIFPEWQEASVDDFPIKAVKITKTYPKELTHRDYLGSVLSNGITREQVGDIITDGDCAYVFIMADLADYICMNLKKIGNTGVKTEIADIKDISCPEQKFQIINTVAASLRLDAVVAAMLRISRRDAALLITKGGVSVNYLPTENTGGRIKPGDIISVRGHGKFLFSDINGETRSQRIHIVIKKYI